MFDPKYADETTYTVEEAEIGEDEGFEVIVVYLQEWCNGEKREEGGDDKTEQKAFMYWTKGEKNHKEYKEYYKWLAKEADKRAFKHL